MTNTLDTEAICPNCGETHDGPEQLFRLSVFAKQSHWGAITHTCISCTEPEEVGMVAWHKAMGTWLRPSRVEALLREHDMWNAFDIADLYAEHGVPTNGMAAHTLYAWMGY